MTRLRSLTKYLVLYYFLHLLTVHTLGADLILCHEKNSTVHTEAFSDADQCLSTNSVESKWLEYTDNSNPHCESCTDIPLIFSCDAEATALSSNTTQILHIPDFTQIILPDFDLGTSMSFRQYNPYEDSISLSIYDCLQSTVLLI